MTNEMLKDLLATSLAVESVGIFIKDKDGNRSDYQNGWNAALTKVVENAVQISDLLDSLPSNDLSALVELVDTGLVFISVRDETLGLMLNMNDTFHYSTADAEPFEIKDIPVLSRLYTMFDSDGITAWVAWKRTELPIKEWITEKYKEAIDWISRNPPSEEP